jgi:hypothetical protein
LLASIAPTRDRERNCRLAEAACGIPPSWRALLRREVRRTTFLSADL